MNEIELLKQQISDLSEKASFLGCQPIADELLSTRDYLQEFIVGTYPRT